VLFPRALDKVKPSLIFSPYHDVRMPSSIPSVITVHDLCYLDVGHCYPWRLRSYYVHMLRVNLSRALHVITVSQATKERLIDCLQISKDIISVVPNSLDPAFSSSTPNSVDIKIWRENILLNDARQALVLYPGGLEYRKNIPRLMKVMRRLWGQGHRIKLLITGDPNPHWKNQFSDLEMQTNYVQFLGHLSQAELRIAYEASDCIIYPTMCEGFGRVCLEAMATGTPLACSDLQVLREVAGNYPSYFNPNDEDAMSSALLRALASGSQQRRYDDRYTLSSVREHFLSALAPILEQVQRL
jgi:glycosyltransferase involved in cell wall biosynthesis